ncbi:MAG TPA: FAD-dependent monooxygenase [Cyclobacteriaceae bacterium]|nr:FAD-dependent monooxygenase [Cyclobacteriaceae bacterium]
MKKNSEILIVGAGPSGLAAALFLHQQGLKPLIVEKEQQLSRHSKALGVNPNTLQLLEKIGLARRFMENGRKMERINFWKGEQLIFQNDFTKVRHKYPFMLIQPQKESERLLMESLLERGIDVQFGTELDALSLNDGVANAILNAPDVHVYQEEFKLIIGADGARSKVRACAGIGMEGSRDHQPWELYDVALELPRHPEEGHVLICEDGGVIMIRLKNNVWRVAGNMMDLLQYLPKHTKIGAIEWQSTFRVGHRVAERLQEGPVVLIGDAAHLHSPVGARGMNLGIEDAYLVSKLIKEKRLEDYTALRQPYLRNTVRRINVMTQGLGGVSWWMRKARRNIQLLKPLFPILMPIARNFILGLNK